MCVMSDVRVPVRVVMVGRGCAWLDVSLWAPALVSLPRPQFLSSLCMCLPYCCRCVDRVPTPPSLRSRVPGHDLRPATDHFRVISPFTAPSTRRAYCNYCNYYCNCDGDPSSQDILAESPLHFHATPSGSSVPARRKAFSHPSSPAASFRSGYALSPSPSLSPSLSPSFSRACSLLRSLLHRYPMRALEAGIHLPLASPIPHLSACTHTPLVSVIAVMPTMPAHPDSNKPVMSLLSVAPSPRQDY